MKKSKNWPKIVLLGNIILSYWIYSITSNSWVIVPTVVLIVWNFTHYLFNTSRIESWRTVKIAGTVILYYWIYSYSENIWVIVPAVLITAWNSLDGIVRS